jgi:7-keto-8-aminopelargonate synthetase-like enzyme
VTRAITSVAGAEVVLGARKAVSFGGCDYLGLAKHDEVIAAAHAGLDFLGASASASRTTTGTMDVHVELERTLAAYFGTADAIHLPAGWLAGQALARALAPQCDAVLIDELAHPALADAAALTDLPVRLYAHFDAAAARRAAGRDRVLVLTDGTDVALGALAPLRALAALVRRNRGHLVVDDAHGVGVLGRRGRGAVEATSAGRPNDARVHVVGSLSKALGGQGGFVVGSVATVGLVRERAAVVAGATPLAPSAAAAAECALRMAADPLHRVLLFRNAARMRRHFVRLGFAPPRDRTPWFAVGAGRPERVLARAARTLLARGFLVPHVRYFGGPPGGYLKVTVTSLHTPAQIDALARHLASTP